MKALRSTARAVLRFLAGEDPLTAAGVVVALALTAALAALHIAAWWLTPLAAAALLGVSLRRFLRALR